jgi:ATP-dependent exoDNAse (exonuclease V) alpha subunit
MGATGWVRHLSVRVPWHDRAWDGHICDDPLTNSACLALKLIAENRKDELEHDLRSQSLDDLSPGQLPPCIRASATFLSPNPQSFQSVMAYSKWSKHHAHILPQAVHVPAWGATVIPYRWMLKESGFDIAASLELEADADREPAAPDWLANTSWIQGFGNQEALLEAFASPLVEDESLVLFYATRTPLCDDERRVLLGAALLGKKHDLGEYLYAADAKSPLRAMVWERSVQHTLRPEQGGGYRGGFVMPYHALQRELERLPELAPEDYIAFAPDDYRAQFSYGSEQVSHGAAAAALLAARSALERIGDVIDGPWNRYIGWIDERLGRLWTLQGPAPGLGVVLSALHPGFSGTLFAMALASELDANADPWPHIDQILTGKKPPPPGSPQITGMLRKRWQRLVSDAAGLDRLKLLARFELTVEQVVRALGLDAAGTLENPYTLFETDRTAAEPISFGTIDRGLYPGKEVAAAHPLPASCNGSLSEYDNERRLRAACIEVLEKSVAQGHTLLPIKQLTEAAAELPVVHPVPLDAETIDICQEDFAPLVAVLGVADRMAVQLDRYVSGGKLIAQAVKERLGQSGEAEAVAWRALVDEKFGAFDPGDEDEIRAREEKAEALSRMAASKIAVLIGPAGTGKTSVVQLLLGRPGIVGSRVRLLAPTGKARVRLGIETGRRDEVQTVAQFLLGHRFDPETGRYFTNPEAPKIEATTCIIDECSMLTEDMLAAIIDSIPRNCRLILVGDPYQLPPIGAGCPFVDIIEHLKRVQGELGVGELTTPRRQADAGNGDAAKAPALARADVQLAAIFSGRELPPGEDEVVVQALAGIDTETIKYRQWESIGDLSALVESVVSDELGGGPDDLISKFEESLGATRNGKGYLNFERGCADHAEKWQILSVNRSTPGGSIFLNRRIKERLRGNRLAQAIDSNRVPQYRDWWRSIKPRGPEQITYGDKVICVRNHRRQPYPYDPKVNADEEFLANGEIGMVIGQNSYGKKNPRFTHVELAGRADRNFSFRRSDFSEDGNPYLELAYAITVHKAQGSEFGSVILVLPAHSRLVSREMIYTALTRQKKRIWILHQGSFDKFLSLRQYAFSDIAARFTNLLRTPNPQQVRLSSEIPRGLAGAQRTFLEERLIHRTSRGEMVSSKNELTIANILYTLEKEGLLTYQVEPRLPFDDGNGRWADFLIEANGKHWYWEHCGMMSDAQYRKRWARKKGLYEGNGYTVRAAENPAGRLIVTEDGPDRGLDSQLIEQIARGLVQA